MTEILDAMQHYAGLGIIGLAVAVGFIFRTTVPRDECNVVRDDLRQRIDWVMDALWEIVQKHDTRLPPPPTKRKT